MSERAQRQVVDLRNDLTPVGRHVLIERLAKDSESAGGIVIPESAFEKNLRCRVLKKGKGTYDSKGHFVPSTRAEPGDIVLVRQFEDRPLHTWDKSISIVDGIYIDVIESRAEGA